MADYLAPQTDVYDLRYRGFHVQATPYMGEAMVHIREQIVKAGDSRVKRFTKRGIALREEEWCALVNQIPAITTALLGGEDMTADLGTRGRRVVVERYKDTMYVNIRNYWKHSDDENAFATKIGVHLPPAAWDRFLILLDFIEDDVRSIKEALAGSQEKADDEDRLLEERRLKILARRDTEEMVVAANSSNFPSD